MKDSRFSQTIVMVRLRHGIVRDTIESLLSVRGGINIRSLAADCDVLEVAQVLDNLCQQAVPGTRIAVLGEFGTYERELLLTEFPDLEVVDIGSAGGTDQCVRNGADTKKLGQTCRI
ncbi:MAG: hypothetical protein R3C49_07295 [Planctomycetaceae bacterium]